MYCLVCQALESPETLCFCSSAFAEVQTCLNDSDGSRQGFDTSHYMQAQDVLECSSVLPLVVLDQAFGPVFPNGMHEAMCAKCVTM